MFNKFSDGLSGLKTYVNSPALGRNQAALHIAVKSNTAFAVNQLLAAGGDPLAKDEAGNTPIHTASYSGASVAIQTILEHESCSRIQEELLTAVNNEGDTPLHVACKRDIEKNAKKPLPPRTSVTDTKPTDTKPTDTKPKDTKPKDTKPSKAPQISALEVLLEKGCSVRAQNKEGMLPIQCALLTEHTDVHCVDTLLEHDGALVDVTDAPTGNGLLHMSRGNHKVVQCLIHHKIDVNMLNMAGQTALHKAVLDDENPLEQVMSLVMNGVQVDVLDSKGDTPLMCLARLPAKKGSNREVLVKALVVLGADLNMKNRDGMTVYDVAKSNGCRSTMTLLNIIGADDKIYLNCKEYPPLDPELLEATHSETAARPRPKWNQNHAAVLALDGGGIRGLVLIQMLLEVERRTKLDTVQLFDWLGGTSTGSMLTLALVYSKMNLRDCQRLYFNLKDEVFKGGRPYNTEILENFLKEKYSEEAVMSTVQFPRIIVPATIADCRPAKLHVFKNYGYRMENDCPPPQQQKVWETARSSSAAPTYFTPHKKFVDGGLMANNPTIPMLTELHECNMDPGRLGYGENGAPVSFSEGIMRAVVGGGSEFSMSDLNGGGTGVIESRPVTDEQPIVNDIPEEPTKPYIVVSFGTGLAPEVSVRDYNVSTVSALGAGRFIMGVKEIVETMVEQCAGTDGSVVMGAKAWCESIGSYYFRLQPQLPYNMKLDEIENKYLIECLWDVQSFIYVNRNKFQKMSDLLMSAF